LPIAITLRLPKPVLVTTTGSVLVEPPMLAGKLSEVAESENRGRIGPGPAQANRLRTVAGIVGNIQCRRQSAGRGRSEFDLEWCRCRWAAIEAPPQLLVWLKSVGLAPLLPIAVTLRLPKPVLVTTTGSVLVEPRCCREAERGCRERNNRQVAPVPVKLIDCGLLVALSVIFSVAEKLPTAGGVNLTFDNQVPLGAIETPPQLLVWLKSVGLLRCCRSHSRSGSPYRCWSGGRDRCCCIPPGRREAERGRRERNSRQVGGPSRSRQATVDCCRRCR